ncbi:O-methyltransferase, family 2 [Corchorus capsularis]|uniref:O-methyltransferase, family 2 n=1 Tax=Corchorus capsularis TaxID=210143 RepID=A0A1R3GNS7_COCAP|nr:O-methyltransferase, family 2 [Corchorus capsularis]
MTGTIDLDEETLQGQADIWRFIYAFADSMALKSAVELRIADIIHSHGGALTLSQIASCINNGGSRTPPDINCLSRIMRLLVRRKVFAVHNPSDGGEPLYDLTHSSKWILHDSELTLAPQIMAQTHPLLMAPWHCFSQCVKEGGVAFKKAHGSEIWDFASEKPEFNGLFNNAMACTAKIASSAIVMGYKEGLGRIGSLVDVGGGTGGLISEIVKANPHIKGINFDLPHVVSTAPEYPGVCHIGGDMFHAIPNADAVINLRKAIPREKGKVIIVECVLKEDGSGVFDDTGFVYDLIMIAHTSGGSERTELEWKKLLQEGGFPRYKIINIPAFWSIIEAYPE